MFGQRAVVTGFWGLEPTSVAPEVAPSEVAVEAAGSQRRFTPCCNTRRAASVHTMLLGCIVAVDAPRGQHLSLDSHLAFAVSALTIRALDVVKKKSFAQNLVVSSRLQFILRTNTHTLPLPLPTLLNACPIEGHLHSFTVSFAPTVMDSESFCFEVLVTSWTETLNVEATGSQRRFTPCCNTRRAASVHTMLLGCIVASFLWHA